MLGARCEKEERLRFERHLVAEEHRADLFAKRRAARFSRQNDFASGVAEVLLERIDLRRFAGAVNSFKRNEAAQRRFAADFGH